MNVIAVDAMGGDSAPAPEVAGAVQAVRELPVSVALVGDAEILNAELVAHGVAPDDGIRVVHAPQAVTMDDHPARVFKQKPQSSMRLAVEMVARGEAQAVVSAGNSGAMLATSAFALGRIPGIERPAIVSVLPTVAGPLVLCDTGANVEVKPTMLAQFGLLGCEYDRLAHGRARPRVGILSNGSESGKGTALTRAALQLLERMAADPDAGFELVGYVEGSDLFSGRIDVVATDGFTGNVVLKLAEGLSEAMVQMAQARVGTGLANPIVDDLRRTLDYRERGGALLGGVDGVVMICHGRSDAHAIKNAIKSAADEARGHLIENLTAAIARHASLWVGIRSEDA